MVLLRLPVLGRSTIRRVRPDQQRLQPPLDGLTVREQLAFDAAPRAWRLARLAQ